MYPEGSGGHGDVLLLRSNTKDLWDDVFLSLIHYCIIAAEFLVNCPMPNPLTSPPSGHRSFPGLCHMSQLKEHGWALGEGGSSGVTSPRAANILQQHVMNKSEPHQNLSGCYLGWISINGIKFRDTVLEAVFCALSLARFRVLEGGLDSWHRNTKVSLKWLLKEKSLLSSVGRDQMSFHWLHQRGL